LVSVPISPHFPSFPPIFPLSIFFLLTLEPIWNLVFCCKCRFCPDTSQSSAYMPKGMLASACCVSSQNRPFRHENRFQIGSEQIVQFAALGVNRPAGAHRISGAGCIRLIRHGLLFFCGAGGAPGGAFAGRDKSKTGYAGIQRQRGKHVFAEKIILHH